MKKLNLKSIVFGIIAGVITTCGIGVAATVAVNGVYFSQFPIYVNGNYYNSTDPVLNYNGRTYLPLNEIGTLLGGEITFNNNAIYVNTDGSYSDSSSKDIEIVKGDNEKYYVSLARYGARSATITGDNSYVKVNKTKLTSSGDIKLTGSKVGKATIKITYNTGDVEKLYVKVVEDNDEDDEELEVGDTYKTYIDLDDYDADKATITYDSKYVSVSKTTFTSNGYLTITAKKEGNTTVKVKYDSGDVDYIYLDIEDEDDDEDEEDKELEVGEKYKVYIDLDEYDADKATITYNSDYVSVSKTTFTSNGYLTMTAKKEGKTTVKVKYDTNDVDYIYLDIYDEDDDDEDDDDDLNYDEIEVDEGDSEYLYVDLSEYKATSATLTYNASYIKLDKTTLTTSGKVKVTGKNAGYTSIKIKFNTGDIVYVDVEVKD